MAGKAVPLPARARGLLLPLPADLDAVPVESLPALVTQLTTLAAVAAARLAAVPATVPAPAPATEAGALTQEEAAARYRIPLRTVRKLTRTHRVPSYQLGRNRMVRSTDLDAYLARCRAQGIAVGTLLDVG